MDDQQVWHSQPVGLERTPKRLLGVNLVSGEPDIKDCLTALTIPAYDSSDLCMLYYSQK